MLQRIVLSAGLLALLVGAAGPLTAAEGEPVPFVTFASGRSSRIGQPLQLVVRDENAWRALWRRHAGAGPAVPTIDFTREMAIAIFTSASPVPRTVLIARITQEADRLIVWYGVRETPLTDTAGLKPAAAFHIVRTARSTLPVTFSLLKTFPVVPNP